ncbi:MAG TPA: hypothetical protein VIG88_11635 [Lysobacter sp.]
MLRQRLKRLRQPKYLVGAIAGAVYMYWFVFRHMLAAPREGARFMAMPTELAGVILPLAALALLLMLAYAWLFPGDRAALRFSEAETAFLFPAPISRTGLIHISVLRAQLVLFVSVFLLSLLLRRGHAVGIGPLQYATALWLVIATLRLHFLGASFMRERLLDLGLRPWLRRGVVLAVVAAIAAASIAWARAHAPPPDVDDVRGLARYVAATLGAGPAAVVLAPTRWLVTPLFATDTPAFLRALPAALALLLAHYAWVVRAQVSFEEASIALARKRAERLGAMREGRMRLRNAPTRARRAPFALSPTGAAPVAFLWKGLIAAGPLWRLRNALIVAVLLVAGIGWLGMQPFGPGLLRAIGLICLGVAGWSAFVGPMLVQGGLRQTLDHLDVLRATPLRGWQIALGQLLTPVTMLVVAQWLLLLAAGCALWRASGTGWLTPGLLASAGFAVVLLAPLICALMLCVPFAGPLLFPGWSSGGRGGGIDVMGQRLIFGGVYLIALAVSLLPASIVASALLFALRLVADWPLAIAAAAVAGAAVLAAEVALLVRWLGMRIERFDVSTELR